MRLQDAVFLLILAILIYKRDSRFFTIAGVVSLILSFPLFSMWVFFTAERLTWYAGAFFLFAVIFNIIKLRTTND